MCNARRGYQLPLSMIKATLLKTVFSWGPCLQFQRISPLIIIMAGAVSESYNPIRR